MVKLIDLAGRRFGRWTVLKLLGRHRGNTLWLCRCECGREKPVSTANLRSGASTQCNRCVLEKMWAAKRTREGRPRIPEYRTWCHLGARNLLCREWLDFEPFLAAVGEKPAGKWLHRPDNSRPYGPANWCWSSPADYRERLVARAHAQSGVPLSRLRRLSRQRIHQILLRAKGKCIVCGGEVARESSIYCQRHRLASNSYKRKHHQQQKEIAR